MIDFNISAAEVALIVGLAELAKGFGFPKKYIPIFDLIAGLFIGIGIHGIADNYGIVNGIMLGLALGLSACGLFSGVKNVFGKDENNEGN